MSDGCGALKPFTRPANRRVARRYSLNWHIRVVGEDSFEEAGALHDLSSRGALVNLKRSPTLHSRILVSIRLPGEAESWMKYSALVVRIEERGALDRVALRFDSSRPEFEKVKC